MRTRHGGGRPKKDAGLLNRDAAPAAEPAQLVFDSPVGPAPPQAKTSRPRRDHGPKTRVALTDADSRRYESD